MPEAGVVVGSGEEQVPEPALAGRGDDVITVRTCLTPQENLSSREKQPT